MICRRFSLFSSEIIILIMEKIQLSVNKAKKMRGTMNTTASFIKHLYELRGDRLYGSLYANWKIYELKKLAKHLDKLIKEVEQ